MERKGFTLCIQYHIWMKVTAVAYHAVNDRVYLCTIFPDIIEWVTLPPLEPLVCLHRPQH